MSYTGLVELKPCPFCGGRAEIFGEPGSYGYYPSKTGARCANASCSVKPQVRFDNFEGKPTHKTKREPTSQDKAITAWNTRPDAIRALKGPQ